MYKCCSLISKYFFLLTWLLDVKRLIMLWRSGGVVKVLSSVMCTLQRRDPERSRSWSPSPQSWPAGSKSTLKTSKSGKQTAAGPQRWLMISERTCWNSCGATRISLSSSLLTSSPPAATLRKLRWGRDSSSQCLKATRQQETTNIM